METNNTLSTNIEKLKKDKLLSLVQLGKQMHKLIRDGIITDETSKMFSNKISTIDLELYKQTKKGTPLQGDGICPGCGELLNTPSVVFCGKCGTNIQNFYASDMHPCNSCEQLIRQQSEYCSICGVKQQREELLP